MPPREMTASVPIFQQTAEALVQRLSQNGTERARELERRARSLGAIFQSWAMKPPDPDTRAATIHQLLDLQREVLDYLAASSRGG